MIISVLFGSIGLPVETAAVVGAADAADAVGAADVAAGDVVVAVCAHPANSANTSSTAISNLGKDFFIITYIPPKFLMLPFPPKFVHSLSKALTPLPPTNNPAIVLNAS